MSAATDAHRLTAEIRADDPHTLARVGSRPLPHFWPMLAAYFRDVLLPPQRRAEEQIIAWSWREADGARPLSAAELAGLRRKLAADQQLLAENLESAPAMTAPHGAAAGHEGLGAAMQRVVSDLIARPDAELARFACRTDAGVRLHSWGATEAAVPTRAGPRALELSGRVRVGRRPARRCDVSLLNERGEVQARVRTSPDGAFRFSPIAAGNYRVQAAVSRVQREAPVAVETESVGGVLLEFEAAPTRSPAWFVLAGLVGLLVAGAIFRNARTRGAPAVEALPILPTPESKATKAISASARAAEAEHRPSAGAANSAPAFSGSGVVSRAGARATPNEKNVSADAAVDVALSADTRPRVAGAALGVEVRSGTPVADAQPIRTSAGRAVRGAAASSSQERGDGGGGAVAAEASVPADAAKTSEQRDDVAATSSPSDVTTGESARTGFAFSTRPPAASAAESEEREPRHAARDARVGEPTTMALPRVVPAWSAVYHLRAVPWRRQFLGDAILPTAPVRAGGRDELARLRADFLASQREASARSLREGAVRSGVRFRFPADATLRWQAPEGSVTRIAPAAAEIVLPEGAENFRAQLRSDERISGEVFFDAEKSEWTVRTMRDVEVTWFFDAAVEAADIGRLVWRGEATETLPAGIDVERLAAPISRVLVTALPSGAARRLALLDPETGWALAGEIAATRELISREPRP